MYICIVHAMDSNSSHRWEDTIMNTYLSDTERYARPITMETEVLAHSGFTPEEIASLLRLRDWYQRGGSDRADLVRHLEFLRFLLSTGKLP